MRRAYEHRLSTDDERVHCVVVQVGVPNTASDRRMGMHAPADEIEPMFNGDIEAIKRFMWRACVNELRRLTH